MKFWLGTHKAGWLARTEAPLFVSRRTLEIRKTLPVALGPWALDSGGFTELNKGAWHVRTRSPYPLTADEYVEQVRRYEAEIGNLAWVAPMDWMSEPEMIWKHGVGGWDHRRRTVQNFLVLRELLGELVIPVLQGWTLDEYLRCVDLYYAADVELDAEPLVGLGSVCRRQNMVEAGLIVRTLSAIPLRLHAFGVKLTGLESYGDVLASADSMAWSINARKNPPLPGCKHPRCSNCIRFALRWREQVLRGFDQLRLEVA